MAVYGHGKFYDFYYRFKYWFDVMYAPFTYVKVFQFLSYTEILNLSCCDTAFRHGINQPHFLSNLLRTALLHLGRGVIDPNYYATFPTICLKWIVQRLSKWPNSIGRQDSYMHDLDLHLPGASDRILLQSIVADYHFPFLNLASPRTNGIVSSMVMKTGELKANESNFVSSSSSPLSIPPFTQLISIQDQNYAYLSCIAYYEITIESLPGDPRDQEGGISISVGLANPNFPLNSRYLGGDVNSFGYFAKDGT